MTMDYSVMAWKNVLIMNALCLMILATMKICALRTSVTKRHKVVQMYPSQVVVKVIQIVSQYVAIKHLAYHVQVYFSAVF